MKCIAACFFAVSSILLMPASAETDSLEQFRNYTPEQVAEMSDEERRTSMPMIYIFAAQSGLAEGSELYFARLLNMLMYDGVGAYDQAVRNFQKDLGDVPTGNLTVGQISELEKRAGYQNITHLYFPDGQYGRADEQNAHLVGTVTILDDRIAYPINKVEINCSRTDGVCQYDQTVVMLPADGDWSVQYHFHQFSTEYYNITRWENGQIDAIPANGGSGCRINKLNLNFATKEYFEIATNLAGECDFLGTEVPKLTKPRVSQIVDGKQIFEDEFSALRTKAYGYLSSAYRREFDALLAKQAALEAGGAN